MQAGATDTLSAALTWATYGTPTATAPCIIRGYTSVANDGGRGVVSGGGSVACIASAALQFVKLVQMRWTNTGSAVVITLSGVNTLVIDCEVDTSTGGGIVAASVIGCYVHNVSVSGITSSTLIYGNTLRNETNKFTRAIFSNGPVLFNLVDIDSTSHGIQVSQSLATIMFNSVYSNGGTGTGIQNATTSHVNLVIANNTVQGFSGSGGVGISVVSQNADVVGYNLAFNNATNYSITGDVNIDLGNNDVAAASPFTDAANDDFDPIAGLLALYPSYPTTWNNYTSTQQNLIRMAAQYAAAAAAGGGPIFGGMVIR